MIIGGTGNNLLHGQAGSDQFVFLDGFGTDTIRGFDAADGNEEINLAGLTNITDYTDLETSHMTQVGANVVITDGPNTITIESVLLTDLDADDFSFLAIV